MFCDALGVASVHGMQHTCTLEKLMVCRLGSHFLAYSRRYGIVSMMATFSAPCTKALCAASWPTASQRHQCQE